MFHSMKWQCPFSCCNPLFSFWNLFNEEITDFWDLFLVLDTVGMCSQIITSFVCHGHERSTYNTFCFIFIFATLEARKFFSRWLLNLHFLFGIFLVRNIKMYAYCCAVTKHKHKFTENCKSTEPSFFMQKKSCNPQAQA